DLLKSVWLRAFRLNRGAHSTLSSFAVKRLFEVFYNQFLSKPFNLNNLPLASKRSSLRGGE
ncbi:hypothetical protein, partial [Pseudomonas inefficax]|uniref:hypothetical protein n=1 Tax=Pseudomonas inefficax TaxID=2078786 RepID=UPI0035C65C4E